MAKLYEKVSAEELVVLAPEEGGCHLVCMAFCIMLWEYAHLCLGFAYTWGRYAPSAWDCLALHCFREMIVAPHLCPHWSACTATSVLAR